MSKSTRPPAAPKPSSIPPSGGKKRKKLRKEEIVAEATRLFAERGYEGASMGDLAERVGLRKASLFHHFASKDALYATVLEQLMNGIKTAIVNAAMSEGSFGDRLDALTDALTDTLGAQPYAARLLVREVMDDGPVMKAGLSDTINDTLAAAHVFAKAGQAAEAFRPNIDAAQAIVSIIGIHLMPFTIGSVVTRFTGASPFEAAFIVERKAAVRQQLRLLVLKP